MLYRYFLGNREITIDSAEVLCDLYEKGLIGKETSIYDVENYMYVKVGDIEEFNSILDARKTITEVEETGRGIKYFFAAALIIFALIMRFLFGFFRHGDMAVEQGIGSFVGYMSGSLSVLVVSSIAVMIIVYLVSNRNKARNILFISILFLIVNLYQAAGDFIAVRAEAARYKLAEEKLVNLLAGFSDNKDIQKEKLSEEKFGDMASCLEATQELIYECSVLGKEKDRIFENTNIDSMFSKDNLSDINKVKDARNNVDMNLLKVKEYKERSKALLDKFLKNVDNTCIPEGLRNSILSDIKKEFETKSENIEQVLAMQEELLITADSMLKYLEDNQGGYTFSSNQLQFYKAEDVENYNRLVDKFNLKLEEINKAYSNSVDSLDKSLKDLEVS